MMEANYLSSAAALFRYYKSLGDKAMAQLDPEDFTRSADPQANSIAVIVQHLNGNMRSRWTDFLHSDGEKEWRNREGEFSAGVLSTPEAVEEAWEAGWKCLFDAIDSLQPADLERIIYIRNEGHTVLEAINRQIAHYAYHVGQIVYLARQWRGPEFLSLSIPRGGSEGYNAEKFGKEKGRRHFTG